MRLLFLWLMGAIVGKVAVFFLPHDLVRTLFCAIPAHMAAFYYGVPLRQGDLAFRALGVSLVVAPSCAGLDFFVLCSSMLVIALWSRRRVFVMLALPAAYLLTLMLNTLRLIALIPVERVFPKNDVPIIHLLVGVIFFLPVLCCLWYTLWGKDSPNGNT